MTKKINFLFYFIAICGILLLFSLPVFASEGTIDDTYKYAWGENVGWINFNTTGGNVKVTDSGLTGYAWGENVGWIDLSRVTNDGQGNLAGYAWGENVGWINFYPDETNYVKIDSSGDFSGYAWGENVGWISFNCSNDDSCGTNDYKVNTSWRRAGRHHDFTPPGEVTNVSITSASSISLTLTWTNPSDSDLSYVNLYRSAVKGEIPSQPMDDFLPSITSYTDTNLTEGMTYYYTFRPVDTSGNILESTVQYQGIPTMKAGVGGAEEKQVEEEAVLISEGDLVRVGDGVIYLIQNNTKRPFVHNVIFDAWGYSLNDVKSVSQEDLNAYPTGRNMLLPEGAFFRGTTRGLSGLGVSAVYIVSGGFYRPIYSAEIYHELFGDPSWSNIIWLPDNVLGQIAYPNGHPLGNVIKTADDYRIFPTGDIQEVIDGQKTQAEGFNKYYYLILAGVMVVVLVGVIVGRKKKKI